MNRLRYSLSILATLAAALTISGCGSGYVTAVTPAQTPSPNPVTTHDAPQGLGVQDYGGHAPLVGAHIYMVQLGAPAAQVATANSPQTYGSVVKSLLTLAGTYTSTPVYSGTPALPYMYPLSTNVNDQFVPATDLTGAAFKYVTTNQFGESYITGDYACTPGYPVMLIGYGGSPSYVATGPNAFRVTNVTVASTGTNTATYTFTTGVAGTVSGVTFTPTTGGTPFQLLYPGESVIFNQFQAGGNINTTFNNNFSGFTGTVSSTGLTSTSFQITYTTDTAGNIPAGSYPQGTGFVVGTPTFNPAATNMAMLGLCPNSGNFSTSGNGAINYIYMNEVSTTAAAYALAQFTNTAATGQTGYDEFHIGAPVANLAGIQNAAVTAGLLYDIQGSNTSTTGNFDGENHTARTTTPPPAAGTAAVGAVPNLQINTIANSLAACVDSNNTYYFNGTYVAPSAANQSSACATLGQYAQDNGYYDTTAPTHYAFNIAQAAFSLARFPQGLGTATTPSAANNGAQTLTAGTATTASNLTAAIFALPAGSNVPFLPQLSAAPNDWSVPIQWNPSGAAAGAAGAAYTDVQIDGAGVAYALSGSATNAGLGGTNVYAFTPSTSPAATTLGGMKLTTYTTGGLSRALTSGLAVDAANNIWVPGLTTVYKFTPPATAGVAIGTLTADGGAIAVDSSLNQYIPSGNDGQDTAVLSGIFKQNTAGAIATGYPIQSAVPGCPFAVGWTTLDSAGNLWTGTSQNNSGGTAYVCRFANTGGAAQFSFALPNGAAGQAGASSSIFGFAIARGLATDKSDNAWFTDKNQDALYMVAKGSVSNSFTKITTDHFALGGRLSAPRGIAVDGANTIWVSNTGDTTATITGNPTGTSQPKYATGLAQYSDTDVAITPSYITGAPAISSVSSNTSLASVAIDPSGNVWSAQGSQTPGANTVNPTVVYEYVGLATPTTTPIAYAKANGLVAAKPGLTSSTPSIFRYPSGDQFPGCPAVSLALAFSSAMSFTVGETLLLSGFQTSTYLNGHMVQVCNVFNSQNLRVTFVDGYAPTTNLMVTVTENGAVSAVN